MTKRPQSRMCTRFFDQVLTAIETGNADHGIGLLVGMLDALPHGRMEDARCELRAHMLHELLLEEPLYCRAAGLEMSSPTSPTGARLALATANIPIVSALRQRRQFADRRMARAWRDGLDLCLIGHAGPGIALAGCDLSNVTTVEDAGGFARLADKRATGFDLICAPCVADVCDHAELTTFAKALHLALLPGSVAIISALLPRYIGAGWAHVCLGWQPKVHARQTLLVVAAEAGLSAQIFGDEINCMNWCELRRAGCRPSGAGQ